MNREITILHPLYIHNSLQIVLYVMGVGQNCMYSFYQKNNKKTLLGWIYICKTGDGLVGVGGHRQYKIFFG